MSWNSVFSSNQGCPYCAGVKVGLSNCIATKNPNLAKEWHITKNGSLTPYNVTCGSEKKVWWKCSANSKHEWEATIKTRKFTGCPYCSGNKAGEDYNLLICYPKICDKLWAYEKNEKSPDKYTPGSTKKVWWKCDKCNNEWFAEIRGIVRGFGCPKCCQSKGEKKISEYFKKHNFVEINQFNYDKLNNIDKNNDKYYIIQKKFNNLVGISNGLLSYDFYIINYNLLIEYQGEFHEKPIKTRKNMTQKQIEENFEKQKEHDRRKKEYVKNNNIKLLEIWHWDYDNIENILDEYFKNNKILI